jgi:hypothetical protein
MSIVLIYAVRLSIQPVMKLNIHNQCSNVDLVSPTCVAFGGLERHRPPNYKVCPGDTMSSAFVIEREKRTSASATESAVVPVGALICRLQKKQTDEFTGICEDTSSIVYLLVFWGISKYGALHADILLVEYDKILDWSKSDLGRLHNNNTDQFKWFPYSVAKTWLLDDNTGLMTKSEFVSEHYILDITISEESGR